jgi:hypothetical protein
MHEVNGVSINKNVEIMSVPRLISVNASTGDLLGALVQLHSSFECSLRFDSWCPVSSQIFVAFLTFCSPCLFQASPSYCSQGPVIHIPLPFSCILLITLNLPAVSN